MISENVEINLLKRVFIITIVLTIFILVFENNLRFGVLPGLLGVILGFLKIWIMGKLFTYMLKPGENKSTRLFVTIVSLVGLFIVLVGIVILVSMLVKNTIIFILSGVIAVYLTVFLYTVELTIRSFFSKQF